MLRNKYKVILVFLVSLSACAASLPQDRRDYILAHPHGWIEVTVSDFDIPYLPPTKEDPTVKVVPFSCNVRVDLNNERFLSGSAYPYGKEEPFTVETGFRFPVPSGDSDIQFIYSGCDVEGGEETSVIIETRLLISENHVTEIQFNGTDLTMLPEKKNSVVTLEDVYEAVTGSREPQQ